MLERFEINLEALATSLGIVAGTILVAFVFNRLFRRFIRRNSLLIRNDPTNYVFLRHAITAIIYILGFSWAVYSLPSLRAVANSLLAGAGILAVAVGFASQHALSNIISGVFIVIFKPFSVNDRLRFQDGLQGAVEDITLRHVVIRDFENRRILIPNSVISNEVIINADFGEDTICKFLEIDISYDSDIDRAKAIMVEEALAHPLKIDGRSPEQIEAGRPEIVVRVIALGEYYVRLRAYIWAQNNADAFELGCDLLESIKKRFDREGIEIPFPYRTIVHKEPREELQQQEH
ncbi:MAG: mechanosensitive ion channel family protein [Phaeodactylibacter sp.]|nr:mechanosensitive ion channel family protein [Phaeodactylibacter sp.]MCB9265324.1 mechanosensitive ion channel family protein [Lewinellaceae bacterium]MCB9287012.1 mechanosensitive ion channel family protein [Lewinellaceae bacterium]